MPSSLRLAVVPAAIAVLCSVTVALAAVALAGNRATTLITVPAANGSSSPATGILTSGDATVSKKPDLATITTGVQAQATTAAAAQSDLASKISKLVARIKGLGVPDADLTTSGYWVGPAYSSDGQTITSYRASVQLVAKWHNVDSVGKALDAIVQQGGATNISVGFGLNDPKSAEAEARSLAIADARARALAMASAAGVKLGQVLRVSDLSTSARPPYPYDVAAAAPAAIATQVPVGQMSVQVTVEVDFALG